MPKVVFTISYEIISTKRDAFLESVKEYKSLLKADGLSSYTLCENQGKKNNFEEIFVFDSEEAFENFDENYNDRLSVLLNKLEDLKVPKSNKLNTYSEILG